MPGDQQSKKFSIALFREEQLTNKTVQIGALLKGLQKRRFVVGFHALFSISMLCIV